jgi:alpha-1,3-rhamnosyl/mannosyltransferase
LRLRADRIEVIHPGIDQRFFDAQPEVSAKPYVLFVSTIEPRKNVDTLLDAWMQLTPDIRETHDLVIAGSPGWKSIQTMARIRTTPGVRYEGYVPETRLPGLTAGATAFVFPSLYEGFGFPPVQALAAGVPTIVSNVSSLPEVAGDGALLVDPKSPSEVASALGRVLTEPSLRADLSRRGREQAARFTWEACARLSLRFFESVGGKAD